MLKKLSASYIVAITGLLVLFASCKKEYESIQDTDDSKIQQFISSNNLTMVKDSTGFYSSVTNPVAGDLLKSTDSVLYHVSLKSMQSGTVYYADAANGNYGTLVGYTNSVSIYTATTSTGIAIEGIRRSLLKVIPGGTLRLLVPSYLAFGKNGSPTLGVPSNEVLDVTVTTFPYKKQSDFDDKKITDFIAAKGITGAVKDPVGIYYVITDPGTGTDIINLGTTVTAKYTGRYLDGTTFDSSTDGTFSTTLTSVIQAWGRNIPRIRKGGKIRIITPSRWAYGTAGSVNSSTGLLTIPRNAVLDFDIEVTDVANN
ncbi:FKBP-type peptidyl-prolyl cis-trans isomerase [Pedobacter nutrimenti]|uniref:FKBP-type peptidyl-prolyl cis-trans isomerase n=1 Tax=Pedobacter nutrimenti TaxID=1241337 RepID=UPI00292DF15B|nr:FKBP-type peptidyl-prolyl cis-trans isomerase [Pedobacter nutrimenti]